MITDNPKIYREGAYNLSQIKKILRSKEVKKVIDLYHEQTQELFEINNPDLVVSGSFGRRYLRYIQKKRRNILVSGDWIFFPWSGVLIHNLREKDFFLLRTNRNRNLIVKESQKILRNTTIGIIGLSIGSHYALDLAQEGIGCNFRITDGDVLRTSNLNRIRGMVVDIGKEKTTVVARQMYEIDPYLKVAVFPKGLQENNLDSFLLKPKPLKLVFEAVDDLKIKILIRLQAKKHRIPVVMFTNIGDTILIDIERYDQKPELEIFNGLLGKIPQEILENDINTGNINKYVTKLVGRANTPPEAMGSLKLIGKELVGRPQLLGTVAVSGGLSTFVARKIILKEKLLSGRYRIKFDSIFGL